MRFADDQRADAISHARLFIGLVVGAIVIWIVNEVTSPILDHASESAGANDQVAQQGTTWIQEGIGFLPIMFLMVSFFGMIALAVFRREVLG